MGSEEETGRGPTWKWVAITAIGLLTSIIGGAIVYYMSSVNQQFKDHKADISRLSTTIGQLKDNITNVSHQLELLGFKFYTDFKIRKIKKKSRDASAQVLQFRKEAKTMSRTEMLRRYRAFIGIPASKK